MSNNKQRMRQGKFMAIWIPILSFLTLLCLIATIVIGTMPKTMDAFFGRGERHVVNVEGSDDWNVEYYSAKAKNSTESEQNAEQVTRRISEEGTVLLKNSGILPLAKSSAIVPFGYGYLNPQYSNITNEYNNQTLITPEDALKAYFTINDAAVGRMKGAECEKIEPAKGTVGGGVNALSTDINLYEYNPSIYNGIESQLKGTTAIVFITRKLGEGFDQKYDAYEDGTPHMLALSQNEKETIRFAKENCDRVVIVVNSGNIMELAPIMSGEFEADAILWTGLPGSVGFEALGKILCGEVNPSGKTSDLWSFDFTKDSTYPNFGEFEYNNVTFMPQGFEAMTGMVPANMPHKFINYDEGIYYGYRYYETASEMGNGFVYGTLDGKGKIKEAGAVAYPFGYGLSYTTFEQSIESFGTLGDDVVMSVKVTNTGKVAGKDVVQVYVKAPYGEFERQNRIERAAAVLTAFVKTEEIPAGQSRTVKVSFDKEDMAAYCYTHDNGNGTTGCYVLPEGEYVVSLRANSHDVLDERTFFSSLKWFDGRDDDAIRRSDKEAQSALDDEGNSLGYPAARESDPDAKYVAASNLFQEASDYMNRDTGLLTRSDWANTFPSPQGRSVAASDVVAESVNRMFSFDPETDEALGNVPGSKVYAEQEPASKQDNGLTLIDMRGKSYFDSTWDLYLNQIDWDRDRAQIESIVYNTNYATTELDSLGIPATVAYDGPNGFRPKSTGNYAAVYPCAPIVAATWNTELAHEFGEACGQEALSINADVLYGIGINTHRSPFGGRNGEYYSEDGLLAGKIAAAFVSGSGDQGLITHIKHFALNDTETNRQFYLHVWADEQTIREIYLKPFEICVKEAKMQVNYIADQEGNMGKKTVRAATAVMVSQNCIGSVINFANYNLNTELLRGEWGFSGSVITDMYTFMFETEQCNKTWLKDYSVRAGSDLYLTWASDMFGSNYGGADYTSATSRSVLRNALHNWAYTLSNSAVVNGAAPGAVFYYDMAPWTVCLIAANVVVYAFVLTMAVLLVLRGVDSKRNPQNYRAKKTK